MSKNFIFFASVFFSLTLLSQTKEEALRDAKITAKATLDSNYKTVLDYTYAPVLEIMGGKDKALELITKSMNEMKAQGFVFKSADVISCSKIVEEQNQKRCYIKNTYVMIFNGYRMTSDAYLLGVYNEDKKAWNFIEAKQLSNPMMSSVLPDFKTSLNIPQGTMNSEKIN